MRILIYNDTRPYHCGCEAVMAFIEDTLRAQGHELRGGYLNYGRQRGEQLLKQGEPAHKLVSDEDWSWCDAVLVNGEGGGAGRWNLCVLLSAQRKGKRTYLVNSIWPITTFGLWHMLLPELDEVTLRGKISHSYCLSHGARQAKWYIDFSYFSQINENSLYTNFNNAEVLGDFYEYDPEETALTKQFADLPKLPMIPRICDWSYLVKSLRTASLYVTGRHHGMYAACKARTPFVIYKRENHKMLDLIESSGIAIPYPQTPEELERAVEWARANHETYRRLFDWMELQEIWPGVSVFE